MRKYFKTGAGQYGEGDVFIGITVPQQRVVARKHVDMRPAEIVKLQESSIHEHRLTGCLILAAQARGATGDGLKALVDVYLANTSRVNNWDLVDSSAPDIVGRAILQGVATSALLHRLARSASVWERRIAIVATQALIRANVFEPTLAIAQLLLDDPHDLIHKATGWMLREVGNRSRKTLESFLDEHAERMPRTTLRYAIERFEPASRARYMAVRRA